MSGIENFINRYFTSWYLPYWVILLLDSSITALSALFIYTINHGIVHTIEVFPLLCLTIAVYMLFSLLSYRLFHTYAGIVRYSSFIDIWHITLAGAFTLVISLLFKFLCDEMGWLVPLRIRDIFMWTIMSIFVMGGFRVAVKLLYDTFFLTANAQKVFIYGVGEGGMAIARSLHGRQSKYNLCGFIANEDAIDAKRNVLMGVPIYVLDDNAVNIMEKKGIKILFVSPLLSDCLRENGEFVNRLIDANIKILMAPPEFEWDGKSALYTNNLREVKVEDLLPRDKIEVDEKEIGVQLTGKRIMITGAAGSIGSEIVHQVLNYKPASLVLIDQAETPLHNLRLKLSEKFPDADAKTILADISNKTRIEEIFDLYRPEYVFHAAAYKHVPMMEDNPFESIENNVKGTRNVADAAVKYGALKFVMISTDKAVNPANVMGASKRICEIYTQSLDKAIKDGKVTGKTQFVTTRFGNVLGSNGSVIPIFREQISRGGPITVTHPDIVRFFMLIPEACKLVLEAGAMGHGGEIYVFDMGTPVRIVELAERLIKLSGANNVKIKFTGLRDGEKLYEEVLSDMENTLPTPHPKVRVAKTREYDFFQVKKEVDELIDVNASEGDMEIVARMKKIVPEFKSNHSKYEKLDS